ncbi:hypothetical protein BDV40DRAFT_244473 [Aspergillus tamarii]|uniref:C2H2-type domain-containing protein n=1 Tax=Aspergillus tamarii TaxID=41984 RepID=A0A5N6UKU4_ASPTM|nr:hypothetical protein BDV40DRAFT_244473 [Aspergillus tamarii]
MNCFIKIVLCLNNNTVLLYDLLATMADGSSYFLECPVPHCSRQYYGARSRDCLRDHLRGFSLKCDRHSEKFRQCYPRAYRSNSTRYTCSVCSRQFTRSSVLKRHIETHNPKLYTCPKCKKKFQQRRNVIEHLGKQRCQGSEHGNLGKKGTQVHPQGLDGTSDTKSSQTRIAPRTNEARSTEENISGSNLSNTSVYDANLEQAASRMYAHQQTLGPAQNSEPSTLIQAYDLSAIVEEPGYVTASTSGFGAENKGDYYPLSTATESFDILTLIQEYGDTFGSKMIENFDLSTLVYPYSEPVLPTTFRSDYIP